MARWGIVWTVFFLGMGLIWASAADPLPSVGQSVDPDAVVLSWTPDADALRWEVYLGTDASAVSGARKPVGDVDGSGTVDILDLAFVAAQWLGEPSFPCPDLDYSGVVDLGDAAELSRGWNSPAQALYAGATKSASFTPSELIPNKTYYWRVDTVRCSGIERGTVWSF